MAELPSITVVIPAYQSARTLPSVLDSLRAQRYDGPVETIVVRTGPDDGTDALVRGRGGVKLVTRDERAWAGRARNIGAARASGDLLAFLDADCVALPGWLLSLATQAALGARAQGGAIETHPPKTLGACAEEFLETLEFHPRGKARPLSFASAANSAYDAELFRAAGGFAEVKLGEDLVLGEALRKRGVPIAFNPEMRVLHINGVRMGRFLAKQREHGLYSATVRRGSLIAGSVFVRRPWLLPLVAPARLARLVVRSARISPALLVPLIALSPIVTAGLASWSWGFLRGAIAPTGESA